MTTTAELQKELKDSGRYHGAIDGDHGRLTDAAILTALTDGPDTPLFLSDYRAAAARLACPVENIIALARVEAHGAGFFAGRPKILFEPHIFHRRTGGRFDAHARISYRQWGKLPYPRSQDARYDQLLAAVRLDVDAGFASASYGKFQICGFNHQACGYPAPHRFAFAMARDERTQLRAFEEFIAAAKILHYLRESDWRRVAERYNGPDYARHNYHGRLAGEAGRVKLELEQTGRIAA